MSPQYDKSDSGKNYFLVFFKQMSKIYPTDYVKEI